MQIFCVFTEIYIDLLLKIEVAFKKFFNSNNAWWFLVGLLLVALVYVNNNFNFDTVKRVKANVNNGRSACLSNWALTTTVTEQTHPNCAPHFINKGTDPGDNAWVCTYLAEYSEAGDTCESNCNYRMIPWLTSYGDVNCSQACAELEKDLIPQDAQCGKDFIDDFAANDGVNCENIYSNCEINTGYSYLDDSNIYKNNCINGDDNNFSCESDHPDAGLNDTCRQNCEGAGVSQYKCYGLCTRYTTNGCKNLCESLKTSDSLGSVNSCDDICNRSTVLGTTPAPTPTVSVAPTPTPPSGPLIGDFRFESRDSITDTAENFPNALVYGEPSDLGSTNGFSGNGLSFSNGVKLVIGDDYGFASFVGSTSSFYVEAMVNSADFGSLDYRRVAVKDGSWVLATGGNGGIYCEITTNTGIHGFETNETYPDNEWNKIGCSWNGTTGRLEAYLNGSLSGYLDVDSGERNLLASVKPIMVGNNEAADRQFDGMIDNVKIYNVAYDDINVVEPTATPAPDHTNYCENHGGIAMTIDHEAANWDDCYSWCQTNWNSSMPICQYNGSPDTCWLNYPPEGGTGNCNWISGAMAALWSGETSTPTSTPTPTLTPTSTPTPTVNPTPSTAPTPPVGPLIGEWKLDNKNSISDELGGFSLGEIIGDGSGIGTTTGYQNNAIVFSNAAKIKVDDTGKFASFVGSTSSFYVEAMVNSANYAPLDYRSIVFKKSSGEQESWVLATDVMGGVYCNVITNSGSHGLETHSQLTNNQWSKVGCSWNGSTGELKSYLNDELAASLVVSEGERTLIDSNGPLYFGNNYVGDRQFDGKIDEIKIYNVSYDTLHPFVDTSKPSVSLSNNLKGTTINGLSNKVSFAGLASDAESNVDLVQVYDGSTWQNCSINSGVGTSSVGFSCSITTSVETSLKVRARDDSTEQNYTDDKDRPTFTFKPNSILTDNLLSEILLNNENGYADINGFLSTPTGIGVLENATRLSGTDAVYFDGNQKLIYSDPASNFDFSGTSGSFAIETWVKPDVDMHSEARIIAQKLKQNNSDVLWQLSVTPNHQLLAEVWGSKNIATRIGTKSEDDYQQGDFVNATVPSEWTKVRMAYNGTTKTITIKVGTKDVVTSVIQDKNNLAESDGYLVVGGGYDSGRNNWMGGMSDLKFFTPADSAAPFIQVSSDYLDRERITTTTPMFNLDFSDQNKIVSAEYYLVTSLIDDNLNDRNWVGITSPSDGAWDSNHEQYQLTVNNLADYLPDSRKASGNTDGAWTLLVRATDEFGNKSIFMNGWIDAFESTKYGMASYKFTTENFDTSPPDVFAHTIIPNRTTDKNPTIRGYARDYKIVNQGEKASNIKMVQYRIGESEWTDVEPLDGSYDSPSEEFNIQLNNLAPGNYSYEIRATDMANNTTTTPLSDAFTILNPVVVPQVESIVREVNFSTRDLQDPIYTTAVWGNGMARLRQTMSVGSTNILDNSGGDFGSEYGDVHLNLRKATDGNLWLVSETDKVIYFNVGTGSTTVYLNSLFKADGSKPMDLFEFNIGDERYLVVNFWVNASSVMCHLNKNPELLEGLRCIDLQNETEMTNLGYQRFAVFGVDKRITGHTGLYAGINIGSAIEGGDDWSFVYLDTLNNPMDFTNLASRTRAWGKADGIYRKDDPEAAGYNKVNKDMIAFYFDETRGNVIATSYRHGTFICSDGGNPVGISHGDSRCMRPSNSLVYTDKYYQHFSIDEDDSGRYWFGGTQGLYMFDPTDKTSTDDSLFTEIVASKDIANEAISKVIWEKGNYPVGDELFYVTRSGHMRVLETNNTPTDFKDDTNYDYQLPLPATRQGNAASWVMDGRESAWLLSQGRGLYKLNITRAYEDRNVIEFLPTPPEGMLEVNNITLTDVVGSVSPNSSHTFNDLVSYEVSNNDGVTWMPITLGETVKFDAPGYKLKVRIIFTKGSTPILNYVKLGYFAYPDVETRKEVEAASNNSGSTVYTAIFHGAPICTSEPPKKAPTITKVLAAGSGQVRIFYSGAKDPVTNYTLQFGTKKNSTQYGDVNIGGPSSNDYLVRYLKPGSTYYLRVRAANGCNSSDWSNEVKFRAPFFGSASVAQITAAKKEVSNSTTEVVTSSVPVAVKNSYNMNNFVQVESVSPAPRRVEDEKKVVLKPVNNNIFTIIKNFFLGIFWKK